MDRVYSLDDFPFELFAKVHTRKKNRGPIYPDLICSFDIETTDDGDRAWMWAWQFAVLGAPGFERIKMAKNRSTRAVTWLDVSDPLVIFGNTWEQFGDLIRRIGDHLPRGVTLPVYVHNLSYEFMFFNRIINIDSGFLVGGGKVARVDAKGVEFRCSYCATNKSLAALTAGRVKHAKASGDLDFRVYREPGEPLTPEEIGYRYNDVAGLCEAMYQEFVKYHETIATMPITNTGHVRREIQRALRRDVSGDFQRQINRTHLPLAMAKICREAFRGGDTHANREKVGFICTGVESYDKKSSYPSVMMTKRLPMGPFIPLAEPDRLPEYCRRGKYAILARVRLTDVNLIGDWPDPYIPVAKCRKLSKADEDNGRVLAAESLEITLTDRDYLIIEETYTYKMEVLEAYGAKTDYLPVPFLRLIHDFFRGKEEIGAARNAAEGAERERLTMEYDKYKNMVNSLYGCLVEWMHPDEYVYKDGDWMPEQVDEERAWARRNKSRLPYQWGVWITAWARWELYQGMRAAGDDFVYCDTDSVKMYAGRPDPMRQINDRIRRECEQAPVPAWVEAGGNKIYLGVWEQEQTADLFRTWGAKKYCAVYGGKLKITVAGLGKKIGAKYLSERGGIEAFKPGFLWPEDYSGRTRAEYSDPLPPHFYELRSGRQILTAGYVRIIPTTYELGITDSFQQLLETTSLYFLDSKVSFW